MQDRIDTIRRKILVYRHEANCLRDESPGFRIAMGTLMVLLVPLLLLELLLYLVAGWDLGFFPTRTFEQTSSAAELADVPMDDWALVEEKCRSVYGELPHHQVGGMPDPVQDDQMELECQLASNGFYCGDSSAREDSCTDALRDGARAWRLLLQVDTDDDIAMMWGDCGMLYFWIREDDLAQRNFQNVWMILQCC